MKTIRTLLMLLGISFVFAGCDGDSPSEPTPGDLRLTTSLSATSVAQGEPVTITLRATNIGGSPTTLTFPSGCLADFTVSSTGETQWNLLRASYCTAAIETRTLQPGQTLETVATWDQGKNGGGRVGAGTYSVNGTLTSEGRPTSPAMSLTVR